MFTSLFQSFDSASETAQSSARISLLRAELARRGIDGFLVPRADEYQNEYVPPCAERLRWLTGFAGSAGIAAVFSDRAAIFVDGRYTLQVREETDAAVVAPMHSIETPLEAWLQQALQRGRRLGYDPWLHTPGQVEKLERAAAAAGAELAALESNPVDAVWADRPPAPLGAISLHPLRYAGVAMCSVFLLGLLVLPFLPETKDQPLPE